MAGEMLDPVGEGRSSQEAFDYLKGQISGLTSMLPATIEQMADAERREALQNL